MALFPTETLIRHFLKLVLHLQVKCVREREHVYTSSAFSFCAGPRAATQCECRSSARHQRVRSECVDRASTRIRSTVGYHVHVGRMHAEIDAYNHESY